LRYNKTNKVINGLNSVSLYETLLNILLPKARAVVLDNEDKETQEKIVKDIVKKRIDFEIKNNI
jgi:hypothetical protein